MSPSLMAILKQAEIRLHCLKNTFPCGIRSIDDSTDEKIERLNQYIQTFKKKGNSRENKNRICK